MKKHFIKVCVHCGSDDLSLSGYEDGGGDYGDSVTAIYDCNDCGQYTGEEEFDVVWIENEDDGNDNSYAL